MSMFLCFFLLLFFCCFFGSLFFAFLLLANVFRVCLSFCSSRCLSHENLYVHTEPEAANVLHVLKVFACGVLIKSILLKLLPFFSFSTSFAAVRLFFPFILSYSVLFSPLLFHRVDACNCENETNG